MREFPEAPAIALCQKGDEEGFRRLYDTYCSYVYSLCFSVVCDRDEALDACQEVFLAVFRGVKSVRADAPLKPWLRQVAVNVCLNYRASTRSGAQSLPFDGDRLDSDYESRLVSGGSVDPVRAAEDAEAKQAIRRGLGSLHPDQRLAVVLFHQEGLTYEEIAVASGWPLGTVKTNLYRGRKELGRQLRSFLGGDAIW